MTYSWVQALGFMLLVLPWINGHHRAMAAEEPLRPTERLSLCPTVQVEPMKPGVRFSAAESRLLCGDPEGDSLSEPWSEVPPSQARFVMRSFLQQRGYHQPEFKILDGVLHVDPGPRSLLKRIVFEDPPRGFDAGRIHGFEGQVLAPSALDGIEAWSRRELSHEGYPCSDVKSEAEATTGEVRVRLRSGELQRFGPLEEEPIEGLAPGVLRRYDAFRVGDTFRADRLELTQRRMLFDGVLQSVYFNTRCDSRGALVTQRSLPGAPRLVTFGGGVNSEGPVVRGSWKNVRMDRHASLFEVRGELSWVEQSVVTRYEWYPDVDHPRWYLEPALEGVRRNTSSQETFSLLVRTAAGRRWDEEFSNFSLRVGPALERVQTFRGSGIPVSKFLSLEGELVAMSQRYEYFQTSPREGYQVVTTAALSSEAFFSDANAQRLSLSGHFLLSLGRFEPPEWILGWRAGVRTTLTPEKPGPNSVIPPTFSQYLGGARDLRGFGFEELPGDQRALSSAFGSFEVRQASWLPAGLQPFAFVDVGALGESPAQWSSIFAWSPGFGIRWQSPVGSFRVMLAHGELSDPLPGVGEGWQAHLTFGEEF